jgi:hypothetical protein
MKKFLFLAPLALLTGCIQPATVEEVAELAESTTTVEEDWGRLSESQPVRFTTTAAVSKLGDTDLGTVLVQRDIDREVFVAITAENQLPIGTKVCLTNVSFKRTVAQMGQDGFAFAKPC